MANYLYFQHDQEDLVRRFSIENTLGDGYTIQGQGEWERYIDILMRFLSGELPNETRQAVIRQVDELSGNNADNPASENRNFGELVLLLLLARLRRPAFSPPPCPRLFISHRQSDGLYALKMAQLAAQNGFAFWVDILDPGLRILASNPQIPPNLIPLLTACIIEMAIINCTHVIACMTPATRGSLWLPYEYGRITKIPGFYKRAAAWCHPKLQPTDYPEYMLLGQTFKKQKQITHWLTTEKASWPASTCLSVIVYSWGDLTLPSLPENETDADFPELTIYFNSVAGAAIFKFLMDLLSLEVHENEESQSKEAFRKWLTAGCPLTEPLRIPKPLRLRQKSR